MGAGEERNWGVGMWSGLKRAQGKSDGGNSPTRSAGGHRRSCAWRCTWHAHRYETWDAAEVEVEATVDAAAAAAGD